MSEDYIDALEEKLSEVKNERDRWRQAAEKAREAIVILHGRDSTNKKLPHVLCHYCELISQFPAEGKPDCQYNADGCECLNHASCKCTCHIPIDD